MVRRRYGSCSSLDFLVMANSRTRYGKLFETPIVIKQMVKVAIPVSTVSVRRIRIGAVRYGPPIGTVSPYWPYQYFGRGGGYGY